MLLFTSIAPIFAQESLNTELPAEKLSCNYQITGAQNLLLHQEGIFTLLNAEGEPAHEEHFTFSLDGKKLDKEGASSYYQFENTGSYLLQVEINQELCQQNIEFPIRVFEQQLLYLGETHDAFELGFYENILDAGYHLKRITLNSKDPNLKESISPEDFLYSNPIIINEKNFIPVLEYYIANKSDQDAVAKNLIMITNDSPQLLKRRLSQYANLLQEDQLFILKPFDFLNLLSDIALENSFLDKPYLLNFSWDFKDSSQWLFVSYLIDLMLQNNLPLELLSGLLALAVVVVLISVLRQVFGFSVFGVYRPLLLGLIATNVGGRLTVFLVILAIISTALVNLLSKRLYLLSSAKSSIQITLYFLLFSIAYWINSKYQLINIQLFNGEYLVFAVILMPIIINRSLQSFNPLKKAWRISLGEFLLISLIVYFFVKSIWINNLLLSYPEIVVVVLLLEILVGRYSGLQVFEMLRFMPLIKRHLDEDEEE